MELLVKLFCQSLKEVVFRPALRDVGDDDLTEVQLVCMRYIHLHKNASVGEVAGGLAISNAASTKLIDRLVHKGLVAREEDRKDRRILRMELTKAGERLFNLYKEAETKRLNGLFAQMDEEHRKALRQGLEGFLVAALTKPEDVDRVCLKCGGSHQSSCPGQLIYHELTGLDKENV